MAFLDRVEWTVWRRHKIKSAHVNFDSHYTSYADKDSTFSDGVTLGPRSVILFSQIGAYSYVAGAALKNVAVGKFCSIGPRAVLGGFNSHPVRTLASSPIFTDGRSPVGNPFGLNSYPLPDNCPVVVGNDVWVGADAKILDGVKVGNGAVIAAGAVVVKDVEPFSVVGGVPAKMIKKRFPDEIIERLQQLEWWNWTSEKINLLVQCGAFSQDLDESVLRKIEQVFDR
jgi:chloramphenicol O-acetyltransferase type B